MLNNIKRRTFKNHILNYTAVSGFLLVFIATVMIPFLLENALTRLSMCVNTNENMDYCAELNRTMEGYANFGEWFGVFALLFYAPCGLYVAHQPSEFFE